MRCPATNNGGVNLRARLEIYHDDSRDRRWGTTARRCIALSQNALMKIPSLEDCEKRAATTAEHPAWIYLLAPKSDLPDKLVRMKTPQPFKITPNWCGVSNSGKFYHGKRNGFLHGQSNWLHNNMCS
jgi:hypothetical protein